MLTTGLLFALLASSSPIDEGRRIFHDPGIGKSGVACSGCHSVSEDEAKKSDGLIRAGHSLWGVAKRKYWRGDSKRTSHATLAEAVDVCVQIFQGGEPLDGRARVALDAYLKNVSKRAKSEPPLQLEPALEANLDYDRPQYQGGRVKPGRDLFYKACHSCHPHGGQGLGPSVIGLKSAEVVRKIREGNGLLRGARRGSEWMPFYGRDRLSDEQVADIAAYIKTLKAS